MLMVNSEGRQICSSVHVTSVVSVCGRLGRPQYMLLIRSRDLSSQCMWSTRKATVHAGHPFTWPQQSVYVVDSEDHNTCWSSLHVTSAVSVHGQLGRPQYMLVSFARDISSQSTWSTQKVLVNIVHVVFTSAHCLLGWLLYVVHLCVCVRLLWLYYL